MQLSVTTFLLSFLLLLSLVPSAVKADLTTRWEMGDNVVSDPPVGNQFTFNYLGLDESWITDMDTQVQVTMYAFPCKSVGGGDVTFGQIGMIDSDFTDGVSPIEMNSLGFDGITPGKLQLKFTTVPQVIANDPTLTNEIGYGNMEMKFCVRCGLFGGAEEVNFLETQVKITVNMLNDFRIDNVDLAAKDKESQSAAQGYAVETVLCPGQVDVFNQGATIQVCIAPGATALAAGVVLKAVDTFEWTREGVESQSALNGPNTDAIDGLSSVTLQDDQLLIIITSVIYAAFYYTDGTVSAAGSASMEFASSASRRTLSLPENENNNNNNNNNNNKRQLQDINDPSSLELNVFVLKGTGTGSSGGGGITAVTTTVALLVVVGLVSSALLL